MKYIDEYRDKNLILQLVENIRRISTKNVSLMEVCGGHTMSIHKFGIPALLPPTIQLHSGPGCPVCVSSNKFIDQSIAYSRLDNVIITTYGDLIRVPGSTSTLDKEKANGADIRIVYSILDALKIAKKNKDKKVIFLGIGFETTAPGSAVGILNAAEQNISNFYLYSSHKIMPPAMAALIDEGIKIDGYIAPGHVSTITGSSIYADIAEKYGLCCVISGFEPVDMMKSIYMLVKQFETNSPKVEIEYKRAVKPEGNIKAKKIMNEVFELRDDWWRGLGVLPKSGLSIRKKYSRFDAEKKIEVKVEPTVEYKGCICGEILKGLKNPKDCKLFGKACTPNNPVGACMVSNEGACHAFYRYNRE
ncbi:MAG: hydrogenase formation protein HypD [Bacteroidales bacterium]|jgi:hydrogenase expression/formation protein HypD|nr:hydrogenase formation protein HypD [Bacteroidales bacterium]MCK4638943.1 hydrogenase formation protein HypD [Bacteroidales bacterium]